MQEWLELDIRLKFADEKNEKKKYRLGRDIHRKTFLFEHKNEILLFTHISFNFQIIKLKKT